MDLAEYTMNTVFINGRLHVWRFLQMPDIGE